MILIAAAVLWLLTFLVLTLTPRLTLGTRREMQYDVLCLGALGLLTAGFFWQLLFTPNTYMPAGGGDLAGFLYPTYHFAQAWLTRGIIPLWNPYIFGGTPFIGDIQTALFYPPNLITYFLSNPLQYRDLEYLSVFHFYLAGAAMFAFLRYGPLTSDHRPLHRFACLAGAVAFAFSDLFIIHFGNLNLIAAAAWMPLIFLFFSKAISHAQLPNSLRDLFKFRSPILFALFAALTLALAFFAGHIQPFLFIVLTLALYAGYTIATHRAQWQPIAFLFVLTLGIGTALCAITLLPALELTSLSVRTSFTYQDAAQFSLPPGELVGLLVPGFFGRGPVDAWGPWSRVEVGYLGVLPFILAAIAIVLRRNAKTFFFLLLALIGLVLALGGYAILHGWLFQFIPGFGQLRAPARFIFIMDFALAVLSAIAFDAVISPLTDAVRQSFQRLVRRGAWVALLVALVSGALALGILILGQGQDPALFQRIANATNALGFFILLLALSVALLIARSRDWLTPRLWSFLALALIFFDLFSLGAYVDVGHSDPTLGYQRADLVDFLRSNTGLARIDSRTDVEGLWRPDTGLLFGMQDVYGDNPLVLNDFNTYWEKSGGRDSNAYQQFNVKYVLTRAGTPMPTNFVQAFQGSGGITIWENKNALSRARVLYRWCAVTHSPDLAIPPAQPPFDPATYVNLELDNTTTPCVDNPTSPTTAQVTNYTPNEITLTATATAPAYLVLSEIYTPGWVAYVDNTETSVVRANYLFRALPLTPGDHTIRLVYDPFPFKLGVIITLTTLLLTIAAILFLLRRRHIITP